MYYKLVLHNTETDIKHRTWIIHLPTIIGRNPEHGVFIDHHSISRTHCRLMLSGQETLMIKDLNSTNGVYVDDARVTQSELQTGKPFQIGALTFHIDVEPDPSSDRPPERPKTFDLSETVPMRTIGSDDGLIPKPPKKWWEFWKQ